MKSHTGMGKRVRVTGSGKVVSQQSGMRHNLEVKSSSRKRRLNAEQVVPEVDAKVIRRMLGK